MKEELLRLLAYCCKHRPYELKSEDRTHRQTKEVSEKIHKEMEIVYNDLEQKVLKFLSEYESRFTGDYHCYGRPFSWDKTIETSYCEGFSFDEQPPIVIVEKRTYFKLDLNPHKVQLKSFWGKKKERYDYDVENFDVMKKDIFLRVDDQKIFGKNTFTSYGGGNAGRLNFVTKQKFLVFGDIYAPLSEEEYENCMKILEEGKTEYFKRQLNKRLKEMEEKDNE